MSSAIEVLKEWLDKPIIFNEIFMTKEEYIEQVNLKVATKEALLALEKIEAITKFVNRDRVAQEKYFYIKMILENNEMSDAIIKKNRYGW